MQRLSCLARRTLACASALFFGVSAASAATLPAGFNETTFSGVSTVTTLQIAPDGRVFAAQQCGALRVIKNGVLLSTPFVSVSVNCANERGLLGITFDPNFATNRYIYLYYTRSDPQNNVIGRVQASATNPDVAAGPPTVIFTIPYRGNIYHHGGGLQTGNDGKIYASVGDHQSGSGQSLSNLWGKVIRVNPPDGSIPTDNPFYTTTTGDNRAIWAYGFRNPFTMDIQPGTGRIHVNDVGNSAGSCCEEVNHLTRGTNYDWPNSMGSNDYFGYTASSQGGNAITGGDFYNPVNVNFPASNVGRYFFADYGGGWIRSIMGSGSPGSLTGFASGISGPTDVEVHPDGSMYYAARNSSAVRRICYGPCPTPTGQPITPTPTPTPTQGPIGEPPVCTITAPPTGTQYSGGQQICFTGSCTDPETGALPASAYHWDIDFHHSTHTHPGQSFDDVITACITLPVDGEWDPNQWWRAVLTATDPSGLGSAPVSRDILPNKDTLTLHSSPSGLQVAADGVSGPAPQTMEAVVGMLRILDTNAPQSMGGTTYYFSSWSDGGAKRHTITMPNAPTSFTANFKAGSEYQDITPAGTAVTTSTSDTNVGANMVDNNLATRWSGNGDGAWARFDLGGSMTVGHVSVAAYQGNMRRNRFDIQVSADGVAWTTVLSGETSGTTTNEESFDFADAEARYVRYLGHGNVGSTNPTMNSVTEVSIFGGTVCTTCPTPTPTATPTVPEVTPTPTPPPVDTEITPPAGSVTASTHDGNLPGNVVDGSLASRWSANGDGQWLQLDLGSAKTVSYFKIAFYNGNLRTNTFDLQCFSGTWTNLRSNVVSSGATTALETFDVPDATCSMVRYLGHGNSINTWNSVTEVEIWQSGGGPVITPTPTPTLHPTITPTPTSSMPPTPTPTPQPSGEITPPGSAFSASTSDTNVPANAGDNNLMTRWSGAGDGAWLQVDLGGTYTVTSISTAAYNGNGRQNIFDIQVSTTGTSWTTVFSGRTSGTTTNEEMFDVTDSGARYVRYLGHMSTVGTFNSVTELSIFGTACTTCPTPPPPTPTPAPNQVNITTSMTYSPAVITIASGQTVTWVNQDSMSHTVTSDTGIWDSGEIPPGGSYSRTFSSSGSFPYHCSFHPGMTGSVSVSSVPTPTPAPFVLRSSAFVDGAMMPVRYTCAFDGTAGIDISPPLNWGPGTMNAAAYAIVFADRVNGGNKLHWMIWDIKPEQLSLPEGLGAGYNVPSHAPAKQKAFTTGAATLQYFGPCPGGSTNPYTFTLYAQNVATIPGVTSASSVATIEAQIKANSKTTTAVLNVRSNAAR